MVKFLNITKYIYRHYKGGVYTVENIARSTDDPTKTFVIYKSMQTTGTTSSAGTTGFAGRGYPEGTVWSRDTTEFFGCVDVDGRSVKRFVKIGSKK